MTAIFMISGSQQTTWIAAAVEHGADEAAQPVALVDELAADAADHPLAAGVEAAVDRDA